MEGMHAFFGAHVSHRKHIGSSFLETCQRPDDFSRINQAVVVTFLCKNYMVLLVTFYGKHTLTVSIYKLHNNTQLYSDVMHFIMSFELKIRLFKQETLLKA